MLTLLLSLTAHAAELPLAANYLVEYKELDIIPAQMMHPPRASKKGSAKDFAAPARIPYGVMPDGFYDLQNGIASWLIAPERGRPTLAATSPTGGLVEEYEEEKSTWTNIRGTTDGGALRELTAHEHNVSYGRITVETDSDWTITYDDQGRATTVWAEGRRRGFGGSQQVRTQIALTWTNDNRVATLSTTTCYGPSREEPGWACQLRTATALSEPVM